MKRFRKVYVEITNICNMHCSFCPDTKRAKAFMQLDKFEHIAKQILPYTDYIYLHVKGEPLVHPELKDILEICNKYNLKINISTNAVLLKDKFEIIKNANIRQLNISLHSFEKDSGVKLEKYINTTLDICNKLAKEGVIIRFKLWNSQTDNNNEDIIKYLEEMYNIELEDTPYVKDKKLTDNIFLSIKTPFKWPDITGEDNKESTCYGLRNQIAVLVDGTVTPCCVDNDGDINLGNIFETSLEEILNSDKAKRIKKGFEDNKCVEKLCKKCEYRKNV